MKYPGNDYRNYLAHALNLRNTVNNGNWGNGRGSWREHKYIRKEGNRYIYPEDEQRDTRADRDVYKARGRAATKDAASTFGKMPQKWDARVKSMYSQSDKEGKAYLVNDKGQREYYSTPKQGGTARPTAWNAQQRQIIPKNNQIRDRIENPTIGDQINNAWRNGFVITDEDRRIADASGPDAQPRPGTAESPQKAVNRIGQPGSRVTGQEMERLRANDTGGAIGAAGRWLQGAANDVGNAAGSAAEWVRTAPTNVPAQLWLNQTGGVANVYNNYAARINDALQSGDTRKANNISASAISDLAQKGNMLVSYWENLLASGAPESELNRVQAEIDAARNALNALMGPSP